NQIVNVDGGGPELNNELAITLASAGGATVVPGSTPDAGTVLNVDGRTAFSGIQFVSLTGLAGGANTLTMDGTDGPDTMTLDHFGFDLALVNDRADVIFANFPQVSLFGGFGDDTFSVSPVGLSATVTASNVDGGHPTASHS